MAKEQLRQQEGFDKHFRQIGSLTALSRLLGFLRDICFAQFIGAGAAADAFLVAFKLPNLFRRLTADGAMTNAFLPVFASVRQKQSKEAALLLAVEVQVILLLVLSAIVIVGEIFMPVIIAGLAPGFVADEALFEAAVKLSRITLPYLPMVSLVALWAAVTNAHNRFFGGAAAPVILNVFLIGGALSVPVIDRIGGPSADQNSAMMVALPLCVAVLLAGAAQMMLMQRMLAKIDIKLAWQAPRLSENGRAMWRAFLPAALGAGGLQLNLLIDMILASLVSVGAISWLYYADRIVQLPLGVIGIALGTALLPQLSKLESEQAKEAVADHIGHSLAIAAFFALPASAAVMLISTPLIGGLFGYGAFGSEDVKMAAAALSAYGVGLFAFVIAKVFQPAFFASARGGLVLKISVISITINIAGSVMMMPYLGHVGLALATALGSWVGVIIMAVLLLKEARLMLASFVSLWPIIASTLVMSAVLWLCQWGLAANMADYDYGQLGLLGILVMSGLGSYFGAAYLFGAIPPFLFRRLRPSRKT